jgi:hypothetical protein
MTIRARSGLYFSVLLSISAIAVLVPSALAQSQLSKEYICLGNRLVAVETPGPIPILPTAGIYAWWAGDGSSANLIGTENGTLSGATFAQGWVGQAFNFDCNPPRNSCVFCMRNQ